MTKTIGQAIYEAVSTRNGVLACQIADKLRNLRPVPYLSFEDQLDFLNKCANYRGYGPITKLLWQTLLAEGEKQILAAKVSA